MESPEPHVVELRTREANQEHWENQRPQEVMQQMRKQVLHEMLASEVIPVRSLRESTAMRISLSREIIR